MLPRLLQEEHQEKQRALEESNRQLQCESLCQIKYLQGIIEILQGSVTSLQGIITELRSAMQSASESNQEKAQEVVVLKQKVGGNCEYNSN